jgi:saccharopine dehydrogenase-like NADP-dependent oxidoreductase
MKWKNILIVGSGGVLGQLIVEEAIRVFGVGQIILPDYKIVRLEAHKGRIGKKYGKNPRTQVIDLRSIGSISEGLKDADIVLIAAQQADPLVQSKCLQMGINSIDCSVGQGCLEKTLHLDKANENQATQLVLAGLFPGLSGIMAAEMAHISTNREAVDVGLLQSANGTSGATGVADMLQIFNSDAEHVYSGSTKRHKGFSAKREFCFPNGLGCRTLRLSSFIEGRYLQEKGFLTNYWSAFDQEFLNKAISALRKLGLLQLIRYPAARRFASRLIAKPYRQANERIGVYAGGSHSRLSLVLPSDYGATAACVVSFAGVLEDGQYRSMGVKFPFEFISLHSMMDKLSEVLIAIDRSNNAANHGIT